MNGLSAQPDVDAAARRIAALVGPTLLAVTSSEAIHLDIWANSIAPVTYLNGTLLFVAGLATVRAHNVWTRSWPVAVTLLGWLAVVVGLLRMFFPSARQGGQDATTYAVIAILFIVGALLTFQGYRKAARH